MIRPDLVPVLTNCYFDVDRFILSFLIPVPATLPTKPLLLFLNDTEPIKPPVSSFPYDGRSSYPCSVRSDFFATMINK
ncbi:hypothetical protein BLOT_008316 [Blomia tropicalis]|nr:hypothetical protein BLOT_008316 [Blomia tropicalis]